VSTPTTPEEVGAPSPRSSRKRTIIGAIVSIAVLALVFLFLFPRLADYGEALEQIQAMPPIWIVALVAACLLNIVVYPLTEIAAIPHLSYRAAFMSRQAAFTVSNIVPGGGAVAVATQYSILAGYRVSPAQAAAAVSADGAWTYLITLGAPSIAVGLLLIEGDSIAGFAVAASGVRRSATSRGASSTGRHTALSTKIASPTERCLRSASAATAAARNGRSSHRIVSSKHGSQPSSGGIAVAR